MKYENLQKVRNKLNKYYITSEKDNKENFPIKLNSIYVLNNEETTTKNENFSLKDFNTEKEKLIFLRNRIYRPRFVRGLGKEGSNFAKLNKLIKSFNVQYLLVPKDIPKLVTRLDNFELLAKV